MNDPDSQEPEISDNLRRIVPDDLSPDGLVGGTRRKRRRRNSLVGAVAALALVAVAVPVALNLPTGDTIVAQPATTTTRQQPGEAGAASVLPGAQACYNVDGTAVTWEQDDSGPADPGAVRAWLCGDYSPDTGTGAVGPVEPLTSGLDTLVSDVQAADEVNLAVMTCPAEDNLSFNVVLEYEDGVRHVVGGDRRGCRTTYDGGVVREGGEDFYSALITAWEAQRETEDGTGGGGDANLCPGPLTLMRMEVEDAVRGSVCVQEAGDRGTTHSISYLSDEVVAEVAESMGAQLETLDEDLPLGAPSAPEQPVWLTLSNKHDDYLTLVRHEDGTYRVRDDEGPQWTWVPSPELSARLQELLVAAGGPEVPTIDG